MIFQTSKLFLRKSHRNTRGPFAVSRVSRYHGIIGIMDGWRKIARIFHLYMTLLIYYLFIYIIKIKLIIIYIIKIAKIVADPVVIPMIP